MTSAPQASALPANAPQASALPAGAPQATATPTIAPPTTATEPQTPVPLRWKFESVVDHPGAKCPINWSDPVLERIFECEGEPPKGFVEAWDKSEPPSYRGASWRCAHQNLHPTGKGWHWCAKNQAWWYGFPGAWYDTARQSRTSGTLYSYLEWISGPELPDTTF